MDVAWLIVSDFLKAEIRFHCLNERTTVVPVWNLELMTPIELTHAAEGRQRTETSELNISG